MATVATLPPSLRDKLAAAAQQIRTRRAIRGISLVVLASTLTAGIALLADAWLDLPALARAGLFMMWLGAGSLLALLTLLIPLLRRLDPAALAAAVEEKYPDLGERLTSTVELADARDPSYGSPALIALLITETESRSKRLDFLRPFPVRNTRWFAVAAGLALLGLASPALIWPSRYANLGGRFLFPWRQAGPAAIPYILEVTPGDVFAAKGRSLSVTVSVHPISQSVVLPASSTLVIADADGQTTRHRMLADRADAFSLKLDKVAGDFRYYVEAGEAVSDTYEVSAVDPVELAADSPTITITPPEYARGTIQPQSVHGLADLSALQHSRVRFEFRFTQPAVKATLERRPASSKKDGDTERIVHRLSLSTDGRAAELELPALFTAEYQLVLEGEHGIRTEPEPRSITVRIDQPPSFTRVSLGVKGSSGKAEMPDDLRSVLPYEMVPIEAALIDDVGVDRVELEYRVNEGASQTESIELEGRGTRQASGRHMFKLAGKAKEGDTVRYRLKAADNRRVPEAGLGPQVVYYPAEPRWLTLKISKQAEPLQQQEIVAQRDDVNRRLEAIKTDLLREQRNLYKLRMESQEQQTLKPEQTENLKELRQENRSIEQALRDVARDTSEQPTLRQVADRTQSLADQEMQQSEKALQQAEKEAKSEPRDRQFQKSDQELAKAIQRLEELQKANDRLAQSRLDRAKLEMTAQRQQELADRAAEQAAKDPIKDAGTKTDQEQLKRDQQDIAKDLQRLTEKSDPLRDALDAARAEQANQLAERAQELAKAERDLAQASRETERRQRADEVAKLAKKQRELAEKADRLAKKSKPTADAMKTTPLKPDDARKAAEALERANTQEAAQRQEKAAKELDRLAADLDRAKEKAKPDASKPSEAPGKTSAEALKQQTAEARQLARQQRELRDAVQRLANQQSPPRASQENPVAELAKEQQAIAQKAAELAKNVGEEAGQQSSSAKQAKEAAQSAQQTSNQVQAGNLPRAQESGTQTAQQLRQLSQKLQEMPRRAQTKPQAGEPTKEASQLARRQEEVNRRLQQLTRNTDAQRAQQEARQQDLQRQAGELSRDLNQLAQQANRLPQARQAAEQATNSSRQAESAMQQAQQQNRQGNPSQAQQSQQQAAQALDRAGQQAAQAARQLAGRSGQPQQGQATATGQALQRADKEMNQAQKQLAQNQSQGAQSAMQRAAQSLQQAAQQLGQPAQPGKPPEISSGDVGTGEGELPDDRMLAKDLKKYAGKRWGDLPGELRTKIIQDMKAQYGDDYARIIKLYFEQIADTKAKNKK